MAVGSTKRKKSSWEGASDGYYFNSGLNSARGVILRGVVEMWGASTADIRDQPGLQVSKVAVTLNV